MDLAHDLVTAQAPYKGEELMKPKPTTDREMILDPDSWSKWPLLPLKRRGDRKPNTGCIVGDPDKNGKVYFAPGLNIWAFDEDRSIAEGYPIMVDDLLAEGWEVD